MLELLSITASSSTAQQLWALPGNTAFVDLEVLGKTERQAGHDTVQNAHTLEDASRLAELHGRGPLLVRTHPPELGGVHEARALVEFGVDRIMIPMFRTRDDVAPEIDVVDGAARVTLLVETPEAVANLCDILRDQPAWVDTVFLGLNDLAVARGSPFLFEPVATGEVAAVAEVARAAGRRFGFGGVGWPEATVAAGAFNDTTAQSDSVSIPPEWIIGEHVRVGSEVVILSRAFHARVMEPRDLLEGVNRIRAWEEYWRSATTEALEENHRRLKAAIERRIAGARH
jgi:hypothetical protein